MELPVVATTVEGAFEDVTGAFSLTFLGFFAGPFAGGDSGAEVAILPLNDPLCPVLPVAIYHRIPHLSCWGSANRGRTRIGAATCCWRTGARLGLAKCSERSRRDDGSALGGTLNDLKGHADRLNYALRLKRGQSIGTGTVGGSEEPDRPAAEGQQRPLAGGERRKDGRPRLGPRKRLLGRKMIRRGNPPRIDATHTSMPVVKSLTVSYYTLIPHSPEEGTMALEEKSAATEVTVATGAAAPEGASA